MQPQTGLIFGAALISTVIVGLALATPIVNLASPILASGATDNVIQTEGGNLGADGNAYHSSLTTVGGSSGHNGWHSHPGIVLLTLISGTIQWYNDHCEPHVYNAGDAWTEGGALHYFRNVGTVDAHLMATFMTADGDALRRPVPACAAALGLN